MWFKRTNSSFTQDWTHSSQEKVWEEKIVWMSSSFGWKLTQNWLDIDCYTYREGEGRGGKARQVLQTNSLSLKIRVIEWYLYLFLYYFVEKECNSLKSCVTLGYDWLNSNSKQSDQPIYWIARLYQKPYTTLANHCLSPMHRSLWIESNREEKLTSNLKDCSINEILFSYVIHFLSPNNIPNGFQRLWTVGTGIEMY